MFTLASPAFGNGQPSATAKTFRLTSKRPTARERRSIEAQLTGSHQVQR